MERETETKTNTGPPDTKYLYYPHVENVTQKGSLLPAPIILNI